MLSDMIAFLIQLAFWAIIVEEVIEGFKRMVDEIGEKYFHSSEVPFPSMLASWVLSIVIAFAIQADIIYELGYVSAIPNLGIVLSGAVIGLGSNGIYSLIKRYDEMKYKIEERKLEEVNKNL